jgi:hypothetical protein
VPRPRAPRRRKSHRHRPARQIPAVSPPLLPHLPRRFSERNGTPLYRAHLPKDKVTSILEHVTEGGSVLQTAWLVKVYPDTVSRYIRAAGAKAGAANDELVARSPETREIQMDAAWSFVAKKNCDEDEPEDPPKAPCRSRRR